MVRYTARFIPSLYRMYNVIRAIEKTLHGPAKHGKRLDDLQKTETAPAKAGQSETASSAAYYYH